jgi:hypothetical protein
MAPTTNRLPRGGAWGAFLRRARETGWTVSLTRNSHVRLRKAGCRDRIISVRSGDPRSLRNAYAELRREERRT